MVAVDGAYLEPNQYFFARAYQWIQSGISQTSSTLNKTGLNPFRRSVAHSYGRVQTGTRRILSKFRRKRQNSGNVSAEATLQSSNHFGPTYRRFQEGVSLALSRLRRKKRRRNALGKVVGFATQEIPKPAVPLSKSNCSL